MAPRMQDSPPREAAPGKKWVRVPVVVDGHESHEWREVDAAVGPQWPARGTTRLINTELPRVDGPEKVTGRARFAHDVRLPGMLYARLLCCPHPAATVELDLEPARALEGVREVRSLIGPEGVGETRFLGQPVAAVAARTPELADDALHAIVARYEPLPFAVTREQALAEGAPQVTRRGNVREERGRGDEDEVQWALEGCDAVVEATYSLPIQHHVCLESHGLVVDYRGGDEATVYASTQGTFAVAGAVGRPLGLDDGKVVVQVPYMGGGFGSKFGPGVEGQTACELARDLKVPIHLMLTREAEFLMAGNRSGAVQTLKGGASEDGRLVALHARIDKLGGVGRGSNPGQPYIYEPETSFLAIRAVHTNTDGSVAFRAPGHPQASFAIESFMDEMAYAVGLDPLTFRKRNLPAGARETYERQLERVAREIGWEAHAHKSRWDDSDAPVKVGIGFGLSTWGGGGGPQCQVDVRIDRSGAVTVMSGTQDLGTGTRTYVAAIVAEELGLPLAAVTARIGDSRYGRANASGGSTTAPSLSPAVKHAAHNARLALLERVAPELGGDAGQLVLGQGAVTDPLSGRKLAWRDACALLGPDGLEARGEWQSELSSSGVQGAQAAKVQVDTLTGEVRVVKMVCLQNCGLPLNRMTAVSQIQGAMIQALSYGLFEERVIDPDVGFMLNANLVDYKIAGVREVPELVALLDDDDPRNAVIGIGEPPVIPGHGAIANAVQNACGVRVRALPITCDKVLMGLEELKSGGRKG